MADSVCRDCVEKELARFGFRADSQRWEIGTRIEFEEDASQENLNALMVLLINSERPMRTVGVNMWERGGRVEIDRTRPLHSMDKTTILKLQCRTILIDKSQ